MINYKKYLIIFIGIITLVTITSGANANTLLKSDKRIKTFVFNQNEVFTIVARNGFQTALEFGDDEKIETISLGDPVGWRITNSGRRVFVKPIHEKGSTNLSVFTNKRSYQFELVATSSKDNRSNHSYIVRFFYPNSNINAVQVDGSDRTRNSLRPVSKTAIPTFSAPRAPVAPPAPIAAPPAVIPPVPQIPQPVAAPQANSQLGNFNYNYTLSGPEKIAPKKIFDDGKTTYFEFTQPISNVDFAVMDSAGNEMPISASRKNGQAGSIFAVNKIASKFSLRSSDEIVCVYNEQIRSLPPTSVATGRSGAGF